MRMIMEQFSRWLQAEMNKRHWNQTDLAKRAGFFPSSLSRVLRGDRKLGIDMSVLSECLGYGDFFCAWVFVDCGVEQVCCKP